LSLRPDEVKVAVEAAVLAAPELAAPRVPGGACVGRVVAAGEAAAHLDGKRVLVGPYVACGECGVCRRGVPAGCPARARFGFELDGALAGELVARARWLCALDGPLEGAVPGPEAAALPREAALALEMLSRAGVAPGETTIWLGGGAVARFGAALARARGAVALEPAREELALAPDPLVAALRARAAAEAQAPADLPWRVFEVSARPAARARAAALVGPGATLVLCTADTAGGPGGGDLGDLVERDVTLLAVAGPHPDLVPEAVALAVRGELDLASAVEIVPRDALAELPDRLRRGQLARLPIVWFSAG
jgi:threonine dehydrogenase-like Zn-dependent dehydrogenase